jgi:hypothetical protein
MWHLSSSRNRGTQRPRPGCGAPEGQAGRQQAGGRRPGGLAGKLRARLRARARAGPPGGGGDDGGAVGALGGADGTGGGGERARLGGAGGGRRQARAGGGGTAPTEREAGGGGGEWSVVSFWAAVLSGIYLCAARSCHKILSTQRPRVGGGDRWRGGRGGAAAGAARGASGDGRAGRRGPRAVSQKGCLNDAPCSSFTRHGASIRKACGAGARARRWWSASCAAWSCGRYAPRTGSAGRRRQGSRQSCAAFSGIWCSGV